MSEKQNLKCYELILNYNCNARCRFCSQGSFDKSLNAGFGAIAKNIYAAYKDGYRRLGLTGGEPLIRPDILKVIALGKKVGFRFIRVQTNGIKLEDKKFCSMLVKAGLTFCKFSFLTDDGRTHDSLVSVPGAWEKAMKGAESLRKLKIRLGNNILINRHNYRRLPEIIKSFLERGITNFVVIYPVYIGSMAENAKKIGVSLPECGKYFLAAADLMEKAGLGREILFLNTPPCFLKGREDLAIGLDLFNTVVTDPAGRKTDLDSNANAAKVYAPACKNCVLKGRCKGVDANYARIWGLKGFTPLKVTTQVLWKAPPTLTLPPPKADEGGGKGGGEQLPLKHKPAPGKVTAPANAGFVLSDNDRCLIEILKLKKEASTAGVLKLSKKIILCRDCSDGNVVLNTAQRLIEKGYVSSRFSAGRFYWKLLKAPPDGS
ncbi:MAG: radical SAM protein [Elusimicrobia bacterium]|nr:radical SAM protein [Elusimicrobiota bacterium]